MGILKLHGYSASFFTSPREALAAARSKAPDLLISDVAYPKCKILLFSGQAATQDFLENARNQGHDFSIA